MLMTDMTALLVGLPLRRVGGEWAHADRLRLARESPKWLMYHELVVHKTASIHLPALLAFDCVARHLNFGRAALELDVTSTAISKTVKQLESQLGVRLFNRTTRSVALSEPGAQLFSTLAPALEQIRQSLGSVS